MVNLLYVCAQYVLHIPSWGSQVHCLHQKSPTSIPPPGNRALDHIMDIKCFISRSFFGLSREKGVSFESLWILFSLLVSSLLFLFTNTAHSRISPGFLWVILVICLLLCVASHISLFISPWIRFFWKTFCIFFFFTFFLNMHIQWEAGARIWLRIISSYEQPHQQPEDAPDWIFRYVLMSTGAFTVSLLDCHVQNLHCFVPWEIWLLMASKFFRWWLGKSNYVIWGLH